MMNKKNNNIINQKIKLFTPEELKSHLEKINLSFSEYIKALSKDFDNEPGSLKDSIEYSTQLIDEFKYFYKNFKILSDEMLTNNKPNNQNNPNERNTIIIDNSIVKEFNSLIEDKINKIGKQNGETDQKIEQIKRDLRNLTILQKSSMAPKQNK